MELKGKNLLIVESPAKARTINKILGKDFQVKASVGHIKDLPEDRLGVDIQRGFQPEYILIPGKEKIVEELRESAQKASKVYIATDPDREGEAIAHHIFEEIKVPEEKVFRAIFHEITPKAVKAAIENPSKIDMDKVYSQQARRILDRLVGYNLSPFLWKKVKAGLSAGRVQSVALRMVVEREKEILSFKPEQYWTVTAKFSYTNGDRVDITANLHRYRGQLVVDRKENDFLIKDQETAGKIVEELRTLSYVLTSVEKKKRKRNPPEPFKTVTLQAQASAQLGFAPKKTMLIAQQLYEGVEIEGTSVGLITYMRTDSVRVSDEAKEWAREIIIKNFGEQFVGGNLERAKKSTTPIQDAHECIRPTYPDKTPERVKPYLTKEQFSLYQLIWDRFIASQMAAAEIEQTTYIIEDPDGISQFRVSGSVILFPGFLVLYRDEEEERENLLPLLVEKSTLELTDVETERHTTEPPPRYTEATLVKALEEKGIGRPSTYATILSTIQEKGYVKKLKQKLYPTYLGFLVNDLLEEKFPELMDYGFTAKMEEDLDKISSREAEWNRVVEDFYRDFEKLLSQAFSSSKRTKPKEIETPYNCEKCGKSMVIRWSRGVPFLACSGYPECKNTKSLSKDSAENKNSTIELDRECPLCGSKLVIRKGQKGEFIACSSYPKCNFTDSIKAEVKCPKCGSEIVKRQGKRGRSFWACSNYPDCRLTLPKEPVQIRCPKCDSPYMLRSNNNKGEEYFICPNSKCKSKIKDGEESVGTDPAQQKDVNPARSGRKQR